MSIFTGEVAPALLALSGGSHSAGGVVSLALICPLGWAVLAGAGAWRASQGLRSPLFKDAIVYICAISLALCGGWLEAAGLLAIVACSLWRVAQAGWGGRGWRKIPLALALLIYVAFALLDFAASRVADTPAMVSLTEHRRAVAGLKTLVSAERVMATAPEMPGHKAGGFADVAMLRQYRLIDDGFAPGATRNGYRYSLTLSSDGRSFVASASPAVYAGRRKDLLLWLPGVALARALRPREDAREGGVLTFFVDESGVPRSLDCGGAEPPSVDLKSLPEWRDPEAAQ